MLKTPNSIAINTQTLTLIPSFQLKHTSALEKPQLHCNKYSNTTTSAFIPTQTHSQNSLTYHPPCHSSISITKQRGKPPFSSRLGCLTTWPLTFSQSSAVITLVQPLFCQATRNFSTFLKPNVVLNVAHPVTVLKTANVSCVWEHSHLNSLVTVNFTPLFSYGWYIPIPPFHQTISLCSFYPK